MQKEGSFLKVEKEKMKKKGGISATNCVVFDIKDTFFAFSLKVVNGCQVCWGMLHPNSCHEY